MDEYISKHEVIDYLNGYLHSLGDTDTLFDRGQRRALINAIQDISAVKSADVQPVNQWISVKDRLPNIDERVLVYIPRPDNHNHIEIAYISEGDDDYPYWVLRDKSQFYSTRFHYISHWMPLPESAKDGDTK